MACETPFEVIDCETSENVGEIVDVINDIFASVSECIDELFSVVPPPALIPPDGVSIRGQYTGLDIGMNTVDPVNDTDVAPGSCMDSAGTVLGTNVAIMTKQLDAAWAAGDDAGGLLNGVKAANTVYRWFALIKDNDSSLDFGYLEDGDDIDTYLPVGYNKYRLMKYVHTNGSEEICAYKNRANMISFYIASESRIALVPAGYATVDHSSVMPVDMIKAIEYGFGSADVGDEGTASFDGSNVAYVLGVGGNLNDTDDDVWGNVDDQKASIKTFDPDMQFIKTSGTCYLLCQSVLLDV